MIHFHPTILLSIQQSIHTSLQQLMYHHQSFHSSCHPSIQPYVLPPSIIYLLNHQYLTSILLFIHPSAGCSCLCTIVSMIYTSTPLLSLISLYIIHVHQSIHLLNHQYLSSILRSVHPCFYYPSVQPSIHPFNHLYFYNPPSIHSPVFLWPFSISCHPPIDHSIHLFSHQYICHLFVYPTVQPSIHPSIPSQIHSFHPYIHPSMYLTIPLSNHLCLRPFHDRTNCPKALIYFSGAGLLKTGSCDTSDSFFQFGFSSSERSELRLDLLRLTEWVHWTDVTRV